VNSVASKLLRISNQGATLHCRHEPCKNPHTNSHESDHMILYMWMSHVSRMTRASLDNCRHEPFQNFSKSSSVVTLHCEINSLEGELLRNSINVSFHIWRYSVAKMHRMLIFRKRTLWLVALLRKMTCNLRHPTGLCHPVQILVKLLRSNLHRSFPAKRPYN